jgi:hypothetical protein
MEDARGREQRQKSTSCVAVLLWGWKIAEVDSRDRRVHAVQLHFYWGMEDGRGRQQIRSGTSCTAALSLGYGRWQR